MAWKAPHIVEIAIGMEINSYASAELWSLRPLATGRDGHEDRRP